MIQQLTSKNNDLVELRKACFSELRKIYHPNKLAKVRKVTSSSNGLSFGYFISEKLLACVDVHLLNGELCLSTLAVSKDFRGQGIARKLIYAVIDKYETVNTVSVWCVKQTGNVAIFESLGFKVVQEVESELFDIVKGGIAMEVQLKLSVKV